MAFVESLVLRDKGCTKPIVSTVPQGVIPSAEWWTPALFAHPGRGHLRGQVHAWGVRRFPLKTAPAGGVPDRGLARQFRATRGI